MDILSVEVTSLTSFFVAGTMLTLLVGYLRALRTGQGAVFHLVASIVLVFFAYVARTIYWDVFAINLGPLPREMNLLFDVLATWGGVHGHIAIYQMIPEDERKHWRIFTAWLYPPFAMSRCVRQLIRRVMRWE